MSRFTKPKPHHQQYIDSYGPKKLINDNDEYYAWILNTFWLSEVANRCPRIVADLLEEFTNDWIEYVEGVAETMGLQLDEEFNVVVEEAEEDEE
jgi:hypothetical protein